MGTKVEVLRTLEEKVRPEHTALIIVDMQNDFAHPDGITAKEGGRDVSMNLTVVEPMNRLAAAIRNAGGLVIWIKTSTYPFEGSHSGPWVDARSRATFSALNICMEGSWGQEILESLDVKETDIVVKKHRYSAFTGTDLDNILRGHGIKTAVVTGCSTNACVESTLRAGFELEYYIVVPNDCCASWSVNLHHATLENVKHRFGVVSSSQELIEVWSR